MPAPAFTPPPAPFVTERSVLPSTTPPGAAQRLLAAAASGQVSAVQAALAEGANINARDATGRSALHIAVLARHLQVVRALLGAGADRSIADASGATPLQLAKRANLADIAAELEP
jgi:uncharacterized protein